MMGTRKSPRTPSPPTHASVSGTGYMAVTYALQRALPSLPIRAVEHHEHHKQESATLTYSAPRTVSPRLRGPTAPPPCHLLLLGPAYPPMPTPETRLLSRSGEYRRRPGGVISSPSIPYVIWSPVAVDTTTRPTKSRLPAAEPRAMLAGASSWSRQSRPWCHTRPVAQGLAGGAVRNSAPPRLPSSGTSRNREL